jgi:hypothetical protein
MLKELLKACKQYESMAKHAQEAPDPAVSGPNVVIQPMEPIVDRAVKLLQRMDPNYFSGVRTININSGTPNLGFVESGPNKDPSVVNVNMGKIKSVTQNAGPEEAVFQAALTIAHERGHVKSYDQQKGFVGGENPAETEEGRVAAWIKQNQGRLQDLLASG